MPLSSFKSDGEWPILIPTGTNEGWLSPVDVENNWLKFCKHFEIGYLPNSVCNPTKEHLVDSLDAFIYFTVAVTRLPQCPYIYICIDRERGRGGKILVLSTVLNNKMQLKLCAEFLRCPIDCMSNIIQYFCVDVITYPYPKCNIIRSHFDSFKSLGQYVLEKTFPYEGEAGLSNSDLRMNERTISILLSGETCKQNSVMKLVTGSRAECFALSDEYTHERLDLDIMFLYVGDWCVRIPSKCDVKEETDHALATVPVINTEGCPPCCCQIHIRNIQKVATPTQRCSIFLLKFVNTVPVYFGFTTGSVSYMLIQTFLKYRNYSFYGALFRSVKIFISCTAFFLVAGILLTRSPQLFLHQNGKHILLPGVFLREVSYKLIFETPTFQGPSHVAFGGVYDLVPALICCQPLPCIMKYLSRERSAIWPTPKALAQIAATPGVLVPTGKKGSPTFPTEWRFSFSIQEICLSQKMPAWVKAGYRAFKYTIKHLLHALRVTVDSTDEIIICRDPSARQLLEWMLSQYKKYKARLQRTGSGDHQACDDDMTEFDGSRICSYHLKTVLLWALEDPDTWVKQFPF